MLIIHLLLFHCSVFGKMFNWWHVFFKINFKSFDLFVTFLVLCALNNLIIACLLCLQSVWGDFMTKAVAQFIRFLGHWFESHPSLFGLSLCLINFRDDLVYLFYRHALNGCKTTILPILHLTEKWYCMCYTGC